MASESTGQQQEAALVVPEEVTAVLEEIVMTVSTGNAVSPTNISVLHDYAMEHLFSFLPMADLKNCRLVNRSWNRASNREILKRDYALQFDDHCGYHDQNSYNVEDIPNLAQEIRNSFQFPWTKIKLLSRPYYDPTVKREETHQQLLFGNLLRVINPSVTELEIHHVWNLPSLEYPNLQKLTLRYDSPYGAPTGSNWISLLRLVETASKLNEMSISGYSKAPLFMEILEIPSCRRKITQLSLGQRTGTEQLVRISKMGFQLKYLSLAFELIEVTTESVRAVIQSQSNCLEHLELNCYDNVVVYSGMNVGVDPQWILGMEFPRMEKLQVLSIQTDKLYSLISYKNMFPVLKKFTVFHNFAYDASISFFNEDIEPVETVEFLRFEEYPRNPKTILQATRQFPKLRSVYLIVSPFCENLLNILGNAWPSLEEMELVAYDNSNTDSILTGLSSEEVDALKALPADQLDEAERSKEPVHFLKNLKKVRLSSMVSTAASSLSDFGCRFALLKMEHLQVLELNFYSIQISDQVMERMREKFVVRLE